MEPEVVALLQQHAPYLAAEEDGRVRCTFNGHRLPANAAAVQAFVGGAKFQRLRKRAETEAGFKQYEPFIIPSRNMPDKLYCALTCMLVSKNADSVARHLRGKAYTKAKERFQKGDHQLMEEPEMEEESQASGSEAEDSLEADELREGLQDMELELGLADAAPERQPAARREAGRPAKAGRARGRASDGAPQPGTPPQQQQPGDKGGGAEPPRGAKRLRADGSRPKRVKCAAE